MFHGKVLIGLSSLSRRGGKLHLSGRSILLSSFFCTQNSTKVEGGNYNKRNTIDDDREIRNDILDAALLHVNNLGWTTDALAQAIKDTNHNVINSAATSSPDVENGKPLLHGIFNRGAFDLVHHFLEKKRNHVFKTAKADEYDDTESSNNVDVILSLEESKLARAIEVHFAYMAPFLSSWPSGVAVLADPRYAADTFSLAIATCDDLCHLCNIQSSRSSWYSDRLYVLSVYFSSELFLMTDHSSNFEDTR
eukprot:gene29522-38630_t